MEFCCESLYCNQFHVFVFICIDVVTLYNITWLFFNFNKLTKIIAKQNNNYCV